jgi:hypothetical protein
MTVQSEDVSNNELGYTGRVVTGKARRRFGGWREKRRYIVRSCQSWQDVFAYIGKVWCLRIYSHVFRWLAHGKENARGPKIEGLGAKNWNPTEMVRVSHTGVWNSYHFCRIDYDRSLYFSHSPGIESIGKTGARRFCQTEFIIHQQNWAKQIGWYLFILLLGSTGQMAYMAKQTNCFVHHVSKWQWISSLRDMAKGMD